MADADLEEKCSFIMNEEPKIESAIKNLMAVLLASAVSFSTLSQSIPALHSEDRDDALRNRIQENLNPGTALICARLLLKAINACELPDIVQWGLDNVQPEDQNGLDRLDDLCKYKVMCLLVNKARAKGGKVCKLFGRSFFPWTRLWQKIREAVVLSNHGAVDVEVLEYFLKRWEEGWQFETAHRGTGILRPLSPEPHISFVDKSNICFPIDSVMC